MKTNTKRVVVFVLTLMVTALYSWRGLQYIGVVRCLPKIALVQYEDIIHHKHSSGLAELHLKCPFCKDRIKAVCYGYDDPRHRFELAERLQ